MEYSFGRGSGGFDDCDDVAWAVEKSHEDFLVDDLLDLGELETEDEHHKEAQGGGGEAAEEEEEEDIFGQVNSNSNSSSSAVSFRAPPLSELSLPAHDVAELEWVSRIMDDSLSEFATYHQAPKIGSQQQPPNPNPMAVKAKRSKRTRTLSGSSSSSCWGGAPLMFIDSLATSSSTTTATSSTSSCSSSTYYYSSSSSSSSSQLIFTHPLPVALLDEIPLYHPSPASSKSHLLLKKQKTKKKRGRKPKSLQGPTGSGSSSGSGERRCRHCGVNKTPQWRTGPMGAKTLCNACGVRYKSGRLLPEYRPACSPTFISHVHSNSHRKVMEMRRKKEEAKDDNNNNWLLVSSAPPVASF